MRDIVGRDRSAGERLFERRAGDFRIDERALLQFHGCENIGGLGVEAIMVCAAHRCVRDDGAPPFRLDPFQLACLAMWTAHTRIEHRQSAVGVRAALNHQAARVGAIPERASQLIEARLSKTLASEGEQAKANEVESAARTKAGPNPGDKPEKIMETGKDGRGWD